MTNYIFKKPFFLYLALSLFCSLSLMLLASLKLMSLLSMAINEQGSKMRIEALCACVGLLTTEVTSVIRRESCLISGDCQIHYWRSSKVMSFVSAKFQLLGQRVYKV